MYLKQWKRLIFYSDNLLSVCYWLNIELKWTFDGFKISNKNDLKIEFYIDMRMEVSSSYALSVIRDFSIDNLWGKS